VPAIAAFHRIADRQRRYGTLVVVEAGKDPIDDSAIEERPGPVMDEHQIGSFLRETLEAVANRILALRPTDYRRQQDKPGGGGIVVGAIIGMDDNTNGRNGGMLG